MQIVGDIAGLRHAVQDFRRAGESVALVPTMGALHEGHLRLVQVARQHAARVVVSIFVNPAQFAPTEDFSTYPRTFDTDIAALSPIADLVWAPATVSVMYPAAFSSSIHVGGPAVAGLEDRYRPHFFQGVATVVAKLLLQSLPDVAMFGDKDFQQLRVVERMVADLDIPARIIGVPTVRDADGLALSSRNAYLTPEQRGAAPRLHAELQRSASAIKRSNGIQRTLEASIAELSKAGFVVDYFEARNAATLEPVSTPGEPLRLLAAARIGATRLIDNVPV